MERVALEPPNRGALWSSLALTKTQLAALCGVTVRQVGHWTARGYLPTAGRHAERYNGDAIDCCVLIKQGLMSGLPLGRAVAQARRYVADELTRQPSLQALAPAALLDIREKLRGAEASITLVLEAVEPLVPEMPLEEDVAAAEVAAG